MANKRYQTGKPSKVGRGFSVPSSATTATGLPPGLIVARLLDLLILGEISDREPMAQRETGG